MIKFTNGLSPEAEKERIRHVHLIDRDDQLRQPATRAFIKGMETKRLTQKGWHSIYSVMRNGESLARDLSATKSAPDLESRLEQLRGAIKPYIQFVTRDAYCEHTGLRLHGHLALLQAHLGELLQECSRQVHDDPHSRRGG